MPTVTNANEVYVTNNGSAYNIASGRTLIKHGNALYEISTDVTLGVVDAQGKFQAFSFSGITPTDSGTPESVTNYKTWNSTLPAPQPAGGSMEFYKCASINTQNQTWTGYKSVQDLQTGIYSYESSVTSGLTYSLVTPVDGKVYVNGALIEAKLWEGIMLPDSPFAYGYPDPTWTSGQKLSIWGTFTQADSSQQFEIAAIGSVTGLKHESGKSMITPSAITDNFSFCVKVYIGADAALSGSCVILDTNSWAGALFALWANSDSGTYPMLSMRGYSYAAYSATDMSAISGIHTLVMTYNTDGTTKLYLDGVLSSSEYYEPGFDHSQTLYLLGDTANVLIMGIAAYNRELTAAEVASIIW